jgi:hypothetical protein
MRMDPDAVRIGHAALLPVWALCFYIPIRFCRVFAILLMVLTLLDMSFSMLPAWSVKLQWAIHSPSTVILGGNEILERHGVWISTIGYMADLVLWSVVGAISLSKGFDLLKGARKETIVSKIIAEIAPSEGKVMNKSFGRIAIRRHPYEEPELTRLEWFITNGIFTGSIDIFCSPDEIRKIGEALNRFPEGSGGQYLYEYDSEDPNANRYFVLRAYTTNKPGQCALQFILDNYRDEPGEGKCQFSIRADADSIQGFGEMLVRFADLQHFQLVWTPLSGSLHETHKPFDNDE